MPADQNVFFAAASPTPHKPSNQNVFLAVNVWPTGARRDTVTPHIERPTAHCGAKRLCNKPRVMVLIANLHEWTAESRGILRQNVVEKWLQVVVFSMI